MISSSGSLRSMELVFGNAGASGAFMLIVSRGECLTRVFDFRGMFGKYQGSITGESKCLNDALFIPHMIWSSYGNFPL